MSQPQGSLLDTLPGPSYTDPAVFGHEQEAIFERTDRMPSDDECGRWLGLLIIGATASEAPSFPGSTTRRFEVFENNAF